MNLKRKLELSEKTGKHGVSVFVTDFGDIELSQPWLESLKMLAESEGKSTNWFDCRTNIYKSVRDYARKKAEREYLAGE